MSTSASSGPLFACTRCNSRHPFEELSQGQQLCKACRGSYPIVKCMYCRTEFQQHSKLNPVCKKCDNNIKLYGKPSACEYCNIMAAFIGNKCQRCSNSEKKYGSPMACEQCKQRCAFDRKDQESRKKVDGKQLCWLCTLSYKRALAKARQNDTSIRHTTIPGHKSTRHHSSSKSESRQHGTHRHRDSASINGNGDNSSAKKPRLDKNGSGLPSGSANDSTSDHISGDNVVAIAQLKDQLSSLQKQLNRKDQELIEKDKKIAELNATKKREEREWREKLTQAQKQFEEKVESLHQKVAGLQKQNSSLSKASKKPNNRDPSNLTPNDSPLLVNS
ncbi:Protein FAM76A [Halotydeus destructor]|nr:Protein FAM76A [Halotydeus destructor]